MSKYEPLWKYIKDNNKMCYKLTYDEIKNILGFEIEHSFLTYKNELIESFDNVNVGDKYTLVITDANGNENLYYINVVTTSIMTSILYYFTIILIILVPIILIVLVIRKKIKGGNK